ncbi:GreA/GreB family elongation factor [Demequina sp. NBRC 110057]|uniref:GreA/GreB family elongation factor n=1 Tax=Demequina sp. NBRC 110057 TaxID=1570346 RepID=UPI00117775A4|nr:GreA/GreB family elongation factor [Demequina sp. NBRC 110057]
MSDDAMWMTPAARQRLQDELTGLETASNDDATARARIVELREMLAKATVKEMPDDGLVEPGMAITVTFDDDGSSVEFILGDRAMLSQDGDLDLPVYSPASPLGTAISGLYVGDKAELAAPQGARALTITRARPVS